MYDITDVDSYEHVKMWLNDIDRYASNNVVKLLVGNKCDLETKRVVEYQTANAFANEIEIPFIETSAKNSTNISDAFGIMVNAIQAKSNTPFVRNTVQLGKSQVIGNTCC